MSKCSQCGECCKSEVCGLGLEILNHKPPCKFLTCKDSKYYCSVILESEKVNMLYAANLKYRLGIGKGCWKE